MNRVLLVSTSYMDIYEDIVKELQKQLYHVEYIVSSGINNDPYYVWNKKAKFASRKKLLNKLEEYWLNIYKTKQYSFTYDYLIVINGMFLHPILFQLLKQHNPNIKCVNFLFDSIKHVYRFDRNFPYFDKIYTFNQEDARDYNIKFLPIYWKEVEKKDVIKMHNIFGFGAYKKERYDLFIKIAEIAKRNNLTYFLKLYHKSSLGLKQKITSYIKAFLFNKKAIIDKDFITNKVIHPDTFRQYISASDIVIDTCNTIQDGLTARFMWATGLGKRIITNNRSVYNYPFFCSSHILVVDEESNNETIKKFILQQGVLETEERRRLLNQYRIDNWVKTLLTFD